MSYAVFALIVVVAVVLWSAISNLRSATNGRLDRLNEKLDSLQGRFDRLQQAADDLAYQTLTPAEKNLRKYQRASPLTLSDFQKIKEGQTLRLVSCSYMYPSDEPEVITFDYKHGSLGERRTVRDKSYVAANGLIRWESDGKWMPYTFYAGEDECATKSFEGTVRKL